MVQTIGSAGESVAAGAIFTLPALFLWATEWGTSKPSLFEIAVIAFIGGALGILFMVPLRKALIVQEHGTLPYPEGQACAEVLMAGEEGGDKATIVFAGLGISAAYKFIADGLYAFPREVHYEIPAYKGSGVGMDVLPALLGVGYICGPKISSYLGLVCINAYDCIVWRKYRDVPGRCNRSGIICGGRLLCNLVKLHPVYRCRSSSLRWCT